MPGLRQTRKNAPKELSQDSTKAWTYQRITWAGAIPKTIVSLLCPMNLLFSLLPSISLTLYILTLISLFSSILDPDPQTPNLPNSLSKIRQQFYPHVPGLRLYDIARGISTDPLLQTRRPLYSALAARTGIRRFLRRSSISCLEEEGSRVSMAQERMGGCKGRVFSCQSVGLDGQIIFLSKIIQITPPRDPSSSLNETGPSSPQHRQMKVGASAKSKSKAESTRLRRLCRPAAGL